MPVVSTMKMTARQFLMLGEDPPGVRLELVDGEIAVSPSPRPRHSRPDKMLTHVLLSHIVEHDLGELLGDVDTIFGEHDVRRPDLIYYRKDRVHLIPVDEALKAPPDLCIEIVSPSSGTIDRRDKFKQYAKGRVKFYWILDPQKRTIEAYRLTTGKYKLVGKGSKSDAIHLQPFADLEIPLGQLWLPEGLN
jgi:Uma2 family endonuclease